MISLHKESLKYIKDINITPITSVNPTTTVFMDIRAFGAGWYDSLDLPDAHFTLYVVKVIYTAWSNSNHTRISASIPLLTLIWDKRNAVNHFFVKSWGSERNLLPNMILIDTTFISLYKIREKLL